MATWCTADEIGFAVPDPERRLAAVRLVQQIGLPADALDLRYEPDGRWVLRSPRPAVHRMEYRFELRHPDGRTEVVCDADNPRRVPDPFGDRSELRCPDYVEPGWLHRPATPGRWRSVAIALPVLGRDLVARIWSPPVPTDRVLLAHDGPDYERYAALGQFSAAAGLPAHHLVLLSVGDRDEWYSANPTYARALGATVLPLLRDELGTPGPVVGVGASLGGLAMLHAQRRYPHTFAGLFLQSGSFFQHRFDSQESGFRRYQRIVRSVGRVARDLDGPALPVGLTCGAVEENLANNRDMADILRRQGYQVVLHEVPDAHAWVGWRDALDPYLIDLLKWVWG